MSFDRRIKMGFSRPLIIVHPINLLTLNQMPKLVGAKPLLGESQERTTCFPC